MSVQVLVGDCRSTLKTLLDESVQTCVTSPPYFNLRDYGVVGQIGLEETPSEYVAALVEVFRDVWRVLHSTGTVWLNLGDSYANDGKWGGVTGGKHVAALHGEPIGRRRHTTGLKPKDLIGIPWRVAFALQNDGWTLRSDIIWHKPNAMPSSVTDRPTSCHEHIFLLSKNPTYYYDADAIAEIAQEWTGNAVTFKREHSKRGVPIVPGQAYGTHRPDRKQDAVGKRTYSGFNERWDAGGSAATRNKRDVWTVGTQAFPEAHYAVFPPALIEPCILAGSKAGDTVLDPFAGSGTTGMVATKHRRRAILCELNPAYVAIIDKRLNGVQQTLPWEQEVTA